MTMKCKCGGPMIVKYYRGKAGWPIYEVWVCQNPSCGKEVWPGGPKPPDVEEVKPQ